METSPKVTKTIMELILKMKGTKIRVQNNKYNTLTKIFLKFISWRWFRVKEGSIDDEKFGFWRILGTSDAVGVTDNSVMILVNNIIDGEEGVSTGERFDDDMEILAN